MGQISDINASVIIGTEFVLTNTLQYGKYNVVKDTFAHARLCWLGQD